MDFCLKQVLSEDTTNHLFVTFAVTPNNLKSKGMLPWGPVTKGTLCSLLGTYEAEGQCTEGWWIYLPYLIRRGH